MKSIDFLREHNVAVDQSLELFGDIETYNETLVEFKNGIDGKLERIDKFFKEADMPNYAILVHSLKSDCKYFGFMDLADLAYQHELESKASNINFVTANYQALVTKANEINTLVMILHQHLLLLQLHLLLLLLQHQHLLKEVSF